MSKLYYRGDIIFLYVKFYDSNNNVAKNVNNPQVRILHESMGNIYEDLEWTNLKHLNRNEYYLNYKIPEDSKYGLYDIIYYGEIDGKEATIIETFHIINKSEQYKNAIKIYGDINDGRNKIPLSNVNVQIMTSDGLYNTESYTHENGYWESYLYPGEYICKFFKEGYKEIVTNIQLGNESTEIQFNNISMESTIPNINGNGIYEIKDSYILKNGIPLDNLKVDAYNLMEPETICATNITNNKGEWKLFLDTGYYFLKVTGNSMNQNFDKTFRLKVEDDGKYELEDMDNNKAVAKNESYLSNGNGSQKYTDTIFDKSGNPIIDVQVVMLKNNQPIAETYTNAAGKFEFNLDSGQYCLDIYHPSFKDMPPIKINI